MDSASAVCNNVTDTIDDYLHATTHVLLAHLCSLLALHKSALHNRNHYEVEELLFLRFRIITSDDDNGLFCVQT